MTNKEREDRFIVKCRQDFKVTTLPPESEMLLRYAFTAGVEEMAAIAFDDGVEAQRQTVLHALGAAAGRDVHP